MITDGFGSSVKKRGLTAAFAGLCISQLVGCGGDITTESISPVWETTVTDTVIAEHVYHRKTAEMLMDPWGDVIAVGTSTPLYWGDSERKSDLYVSKLTQDGEEVWTQLIDFNNTPEEADAATVNTDNGDIYIVAGSKVAAVDRFGSTLWQTTTTASHRDIQFENGLIYLAGGDLTILNTQGDVLQQTATINSWGLEVLADESVIVAGQDGVEKFDSYGNLVWSANSESDAFAVANIHIDSTGSIYVAQNTANKGSRVSKYSDAGERLWTSKIDFNRETFGASGLPLIAPMPNGNLLLAMSGCDNGSCTREISEIDTANGSLVDKTSYSAEPVNKISVLSDSRIAVFGTGDLDVLDTETNTRYTFSSDVDVPAILNGGMHVEGNDIYVSYEGKTLSHNGMDNNRPVIVGRFNL